MPAQDIFHEHVKAALQRDQWTITHDPLRVQFGASDAFIDLGAEKILAAEKDGRRIAVEIKSFVGASILTDFHIALGQCLNYQVALESQDPGRTLYLAIPIDAYHPFFEQAVVQTIIKRYSVHLLVYDPERKEVVLWIDEHTIAS